MMRRSFMRNTGAGVVAAPVVISGIRVKPPSPIAAIDGFAPNQIRGAIANPLELLKRAKRTQYQDAMNTFEQIQYNICGRHQIIGHLNLNISSLKSVSIQHKAIMQETFVTEMHRAKMSWKDKLLQQFGLAKEDVYDDNGPAQRMGRY